MPRQNPNLAIRNDDLTAAVAAGVIDEPTALRLASFVSGGGTAADPDDESFRLLTGFNDIFVAIGLALFFGAIFSIFHAAAGFVAALSSWALAELFTRRMRMALPSLILLLMFVCAAGLTALWLGSDPPKNNWSWYGDIKPWAPFAAAIAAMAAACLHWWRFHVPITIAAGMAALALLLHVSLNYLMGDNSSFPILVTFATGLLTFLLAMYFDRQDRARGTQLSDRAFWLHMLAAPLIVHPLIWPLISGSSLANGAAFLIILLFMILGLVALTVDRRAMLVSSLAYLGTALASFIRASAASPGSEVSLSILAVGAVVLALSAGWKPLRAKLLPLLPKLLQDQVPLTR